MAEVCNADGWLTRGRGSQSSFRGIDRVGHPSAIRSAAASMAWQNMKAMRGIWSQHHKPEAGAAESRERPLGWGTVRLPSCEDQNCKRRKMTRHKKVHMPETNNVIMFFGMILGFETAVPLSQSSCDRCTVLGPKASNLRHVFGPSRAVL